MSGGAPPAGSGGSARSAAAAPRKRALGALGKQLPFVKKPNKAPPKRQKTCKQKSRIPPKNKTREKEKKKKKATLKLEVGNSTRWRWEGSPGFEAWAALGTGSRARCPCRGTRSSCSAFWASRVWKVLPVSLFAKHRAPQSSGDRRKRCFLVARGLCDPPVLNIIAQGGQGVGRRSPPQIHQGISFGAVLRHPWAWAPQASTMLAAGVLLHGAG